MTAVEVKASEQQLRSVIENVFDVIAIVDRHGRLQFKSPSMERQLGYRADDLAGRRLAELIHPDDAPRATAFFEKQWVPNTPTRFIDLRVRHGDDSWRLFSAVVSVLVRGTRTTSLMINARDITDRALLEAQLEQTKRLDSLGCLAATVAHEFNNVLMGIQPFADLMQRSDIPHEAIAKGARHVASSIVRGKRVALDILRFTNPTPPTLKPVDIELWWRDLVPELRAIAGGGIALASSVGERLTMLADAGQLTQVFANLVGNARDAMPHGGRLRLSADRGRAGQTFPFGLVSSPENFIHFTVTDSGIGMDEHVRIHAFDPLFTTKQNAGTGLGLAVAHRAVAAHGGQIFVESTPGSGSTFHLFIPAVGAADAEPHDRRDAGDAKAAAAPRYRRILIVDDEPTVVEGLAELMRSDDVSVRVAFTGNAAIQSAWRFHPDLAIVDIRLPDIDGFEVAARLRAENPGLKIVFASGNFAADFAPLLNRTTAFIQKPFDLPALEAAIAVLDDDRSS